MGGGRRGLLPDTTTDPEYGDSFGRRDDGRNIIDEWAALRDELGESHEYVWNKNGLDAVDADTTDFLMGKYEFYEGRKCWFTIGAQTQINIGAMSAPNNSKNYSLLHDELYMQCMFFKTNQENIRRRKVLGMKVFPQTRYLYENNRAGSVIRGKASGCVSL